MSDIQFINGLNFKAPNERAPDYVKAKGSIKRADLIATLQGMDGEWVNFDVKVSQSGKWYAAVDTWKPEGKNEPRQERARTQPASSSRQPEPAHADGFDDSDIPFKQGFAP